MWVKTVASKLAKDYGGGGARKKVSGTAGDGQCREISEVNEWK